MNPNNLKLLLVTLACIIFFFPGTQTAARGKRTASQHNKVKRTIDLDNLRFRSLSIKDGLSQSTIHEIFQDAKGFMWFGTQEGLNKYDGKKITVYPSIPRDNTTLSHATATSLIEDKNGIIWVSTMLGGLNKLDPSTGHITYFRHDPKNPKSIAHDTIWKMIPAPGKQMWLVHLNRELELFEPGKGPVQKFKHRPGKPGGLGKGAIMNALYDTKGRFWVVTYGSGLNVYEPEKKQFINLIEQKKIAAGAPADINSICTGIDGSLWLGVNEKGLVKFNPGNYTFTVYPYILKNHKTKRPTAYISILQDLDGLVWIGTYGEGLVAFNPVDERFTQIKANPRTPGGLTGEFVTRIYEDRSRVLWFGTKKGGLSILPRYRDKFKHYYHRPDDPNSLSGDHITRIHEDHTGVLWIGTDGEGLSKFDRKTGRINRYGMSIYKENNISGNRINALAEAPAGVLWIGYKGAGLDRLDIKTNTITHYYYRRDNPDPGNTISTNFISEIMELTPTRLWIGSPYGIDQLDIQTGRFSLLQIRPSPGKIIVPNSVSCFYRGKSAAVWVGTFKGLNRYNPGDGTFKRYTSNAAAPESMHHDRISSLCEDNDGNLWIGTRFGLEKFDPKTQTFTLYTTRDGLPDNMIYGILSDQEGNLWISSNKGIFTVNPSMDSIKSYGPESGLQDYEFNSNAYYQSPSGEMFFGGLHGFNAFHPGKIQYNPIKPPVAFTSFELFNTPVTPGRDSVLKRAADQTGEISLSHSQNIFAFEFAALEYTAPGQNRFKYKMEGLSDRWLPLGKNNRVSFSGIEPGSYTLRVKACNNDYIWNEKGASIKITITPPFYATWWFRVLVLLAAAAAVYLWHQNRMKHLRLQIHTQNQMDRICEKYKISKREREVLDLVLKGKTNKEIEDELYISLRTVKAHIYNSFKKFGVQSRLELINFIQKGKPASPQ